MRKLATVLLVAAALPALADDPPPANAPAKTIYNFAPPPTTCYFIRQVNRQLQAPQEKPRFLRIADIEKLPVAAPFENCMPEQQVIKTVIKADYRK
jgi:hypothetical protein